MLNSTVFDVVIGLVFIFFVFGLLVSGINELVRKVLNTRSKSLWGAIRRMLDEGEYTWPKNMSVTLEAAPGRSAPAGLAPSGAEGDEVAPQAWPLFDKLFNHPLIARLDPTPSGRASRLSHIPPTEFARALVDILAPRDGSPAPVWSKIGDEINKLPAPLRSQLQVLWEEAQGNVRSFRIAIEEWFDAGMQRVSDWYKKRSRVAMFVYGLGVAILFNVSAVIVTVDLYENEIVRETLVGLAAQRVAVVEDEPVDPVSGCADRECVQREVAAIVDTGLPVWWRECPVGSETRICGFENVGRGAASIVGWLVTAAALSMGASFWFAILKKAFRLRPQTSEAES